ncbi:Dyp-type peroxidase [Marinobacter sp. SS21]|uniref:Dyp-type peroxidase n=1 Tax=Marinobacter sp. SS21 TaxID=2979460 RepID=UPI00232CB941|nr:peroxidase [Marinobacter sp. SS21]MDC0664120.1 peroxidase [Marinobacter sp. SS21]
MATAGDIDFSDIQGLVVRGYGGLPEACYLLLRIREREPARVWLQARLAELSYADNRPRQQALNLALSYHGLVALGIEEEILVGFADPFRSGMTTPHKRRLLGDEGGSAPERWQWGGPDSPPVDILLLCFADGRTRLAKLLASVTDDLDSHGLTEVARLDTQSLPDFREHFGFRDSIGQPYVAEFDRQTRADRHPVPLGEFLLGYPNGYQRYTQRPLVEAGLDPQALLATDPQGSPLRDLGLNGSYLVLRQLAQDVPGFWRFVRDQAGAGSAVALAARMVGRWPSGTALVQSPDGDVPGLEDKDNFAYHASDSEGLKCPLGAHIRRTHPRDSLAPEPGSDKSIAFSNRHRLLRRGRAYGPPFDPSADPVRYLADLDREPEPVERGLHFICLNANIGRQFEFVQHTWASNPNFNGLYRDPDPLIGARTAHGQRQDQFTIQQRPLRRQVRGMPAFVTTRGGGYFFLPSRRGGQFLAQRPVRQRIANKRAAD